MKHSRLFHTVIPVFNVISFLAIVVSSDLSTKQNKKQPNIIFILADDAVNKDFSIWGLCNMVMSDVTFRIDGSICVVVDRVGMTSAFTVRPKSRPQILTHWH